MHTPDNTRRRKSAGDVGNSLMPGEDDVRVRSRSGDSGNETDSSETSVEKSFNRSGKSTNSF